MRAIVVHQYGALEVLSFEEYPDPVPRLGKVSVRVAATSVNLIDYKRRAGLTTDFYPLRFPGLIGVDMAGSAVEIREAYASRGSRGWARFLSQALLEMLPRGHRSGARLLRQARLHGDAQRDRTQLRQSKEKSNGDVGSSHEG